MAPNLLAGSIGFVACPPCALSPRVFSWPPPEAASSSASSRARSSCRRLSSAWWRDRSSAALLSAAQQLLLPHGLGVGQGFGQGSLLRRLRRGGRIGLPSGLASRAGCARPRATASIQILHRRRPRITRAAAAIEHPAPLARHRCRHGDLLRGRRSPEWHGRGPAGASSPATPPPTAAAPCRP